MALNSSLLITTLPLSTTIYNFLMNSLTVLKLQALQVRVSLGHGTRGERAHTLTLPSSPLFATQLSTGRASVLLHLHCFKTQMCQRQNWERYLNAVIWEPSGIFIHNRRWVSTSSSSLRIVSWASTVSCSTSFLILTSSRKTAFLVNVRSFFVDFYLCHFLVAEGSSLETGVPASAGVTRSITTRSFQLVPKPVPSRFQHVCQSLFLLPCGGFVRN